jgi:hypothetical protein
MPSTGRPTRPAFLRRHALPLEAFALDAASAAGARPDLLALALDAGAVRIARFGAAQRPPLSGGTRR